MKISYIPNRLECKYILDVATLFKVEQYLEDLRLVKDEYSENGFYTVNSVYFDTPSLYDYYAKEAGLLKRKKLRARIYKDRFDNPKTVWLELKKKHNLSIMKERIVLKGDEWQKLLNRDTTYFLDLLKQEEQNPETSKALKEFMFHYVKGSYKPIAYVQYKRKAYLARFTSPMRITIDKDIRAQRFGSITESEGPIFTNINKNEAVLEVKFNGRVPWWFKDMVGRFCLKRTTFSKYNLSVNALRNEIGLPLNK